MSDPAIVWRLLDAALLAAGVFGSLAIFAALDRRAHHR